MRRMLVILVSLVGFAAIVVALAPASLAGVALQRASGGAVTLAVADGTLWHGRGTITSGPALRVPVAWSIDPWPLVRGELWLHLSPPNAAGPSPHGEIVARRGALSLHDLDVTLPASLVEAFVPRSGIRTAGDVRLTTPSLDWTPAAFAGGARIVWQDAELALSVDPALRLGTVSTALAAEADRLTGPVTNEGGAYDVRGSVSLSASGAPSMAITMTPRGGDPAQTRSLAIAPAADGSWNFEFRAGPP